MGHFVIAYCVLQYQSANIGFSMPCLKQKAFFPMENNANNQYINFRMFQKQIKKEISMKI